MKVIMNSKVQPLEKKIQPFQEFQRSKLCWVKISPGNYCPLRLHVKSNHDQEGSLEIIATTSDLIWFHDCNDLVSHEIYVEKTFSHYFLLAGHKPTLDYQVTRSLLSENSKLTICSAAWAAFCSYKLQLRLRLHSTNGLASVVLPLQLRST